MDPITLGVVIVVVPIVLALVSRGANASVEPGELRYSRPLRWGSLLLGLVPPLAIFTIVLFVQAGPVRPDDRVPIALLSLIFPALALPAVLEFFRVRHRFDDAGLIFHSPWSKHRQIAWTDVAAVRWRPVMKSLDLETSAGETVHLSPWLAGLKPFADVALARIPSAVLTAQAQGRAVLQLMSLGVAGELMTSPLKPSQLLALRTPRAPAPKL